MHVDGLDGGDLSCAEVQLDQKLRSGLKNCLVEAVQGGVLDHVFNLLCALLLGWVQHGQPDGHQGFLQRVDKGDAEDDAGKVSQFCFPLVDRFP